MHAATECNPSGEGKPLKGGIINFLWAEGSTVGLILNDSGPSASDYRRGQAGLGP